VLSRWASGATAAIYLQVVVGAAMRHAYTTDGRPVAFALPASPRVFADLLPLAQLTSWDAGLDFLHRLVALAIALFVTLAAVRVFRRHPADRQLVGPAIVLALVLLAQVALGALTVLSGGHPAVSTTHAAAVILALAASLVLAFRSSHIGTATPPAAGSTLAAKGLAA
jgi:heme A synthase